MFSCVFEGEGDGESLLGVPSYFKGYTEIKFLSRSESFGVDSWYQERGILFVVV